MQLLPNPELTPGECSTCGRAEGPVVDALRENAHGRIYVCSICVQTMAELTGVLAAARSARDEATRKMIQAEKALVAERQSFDELQKAVVLTLRQGAVTRAGTIHLRRRPV